MKTEIDIKSARAELKRLRTAVKQIKGGIEEATNNLENTAGFLDNVACELQLADVSASFFFNEEDRSLKLHLWHHHNEASRDLDFRVMVYDLYQDHGLEVLDAFMDVIKNLKQERLAQAEYKASPRSKTVDKMLKKTFGLRSLPPPVAE